MQIREAIMRNDRANRQQTDLQEDLEGLIRDWCSENGFGSDPVTVYTSTELANRLLDALAGGISSNDALASFGTAPAEAGYLNLHGEVGNIVELEFPDNVLVERFSIEFRSPAPSNVAVNVS
jgi:hypothetical protein